MQQYHRWFQPLSDPLPISSTIASPHHGFNSTLVTVSTILSELVLETAALSIHSTYRDVAHFFRTHTQAIGVLIQAEEDTNGRLVGMISRSSFVQWRFDLIARSHQQWLHALQQPLAAIADRWQAAQTYLLIDQQLLLEDAISLVLERPAPDCPDPIVVQTADGAALTDANGLFAAYIRWGRSQPSLGNHQDLGNLRRQHQLILNAVGEGVYGVDRWGKVTFVNPAAAQMIGWQAQDLIGKSMHDVLHHSKPDHSPYLKQDCPIYAAFQDGIIHRVADEVFWRKDGTNFPVEYISTPMRDEQGHLIGAVVTFRDITQRKWAEAVLHRANEELEQIVQERTGELQQANAQLQALSDLRSRVVSMVCHEFRNPLNTILLTVSSLDRYDAQLLPLQKQRYLMDIQDNVQRMTQMIDAMLVIGKVEAQCIDVQPNQFNVVAFCRQLVAELQPGTDTGADAQRIMFISSAKRLLVTLDQQLLRSILTNILSNALRYSSDQSPVQFKLQRRRQQVSFQIKDQGIGIPPDDRPYLFEPFHRGRNVSNIPGTGLGLNIVKRFVDLQQGTIEVNSTLGVGTEFTVLLPLTMASNNHDHCHNSPPYHGIITPQSEVDLGWATTQ